MQVICDVDLYLPAFKDMWFTNNDDRYRVMPGARSTGKTYNFIGLESIFKILSDERRNILMVRQNDKDNRNSNFPIIKAIIRKLGLTHLFKFNNSDLKITRKDTGQVILFAGMNDVENITGTSVEFGYWTDIYFEEASQLKSYEDFRVVDGSIRIPNYEPDLKAQITFLFNAWDIGHWLYDVFFKGRMEDNVEELETNHYMFYHDPNFTLGADGKGLSLHKSSSFCNPYNSEDRIQGAYELKKVAYDIYKVEVLGCWGHAGLATYPYFNDNLIISHAQAMNMNYVYYLIGIDIGGTNGEGKIKKEEYRSAMTMELTGLTNDFSKLVSINEYFYTNEGQIKRKDGPEIAEDMIKKIIEWINLYDRHPVLMKNKIIVYVESADPGDFQGLLRAKAQEYGLYNVVFTNSTKNKIQSRVDFDNLLMAFGEHLFTDQCPNLIREIKASKHTEEGKARDDGNDHAINGSEYSWIPMLPRIKRYKNFKER